MEKISILNRIMFLFTGHAAGYMVVKGVEPFSSLVVFYYTVSFGTILLMSILSMLFGFELLRNELIMSFSALIPSGLTLGLVYQFLPELHLIYLFISIMGLLVIIYSVHFAVEKVKVTVIATVHGLSGMILVILPLILFINEKQSLSVMYISVGSIIISLGGLLQSLIKTDKIKFDSRRIFKIFPFILLASTVFFIMGLKI